MTELLYLKDCYMKEFEATVLSVNENFIELDKTAFYPLGGGQPNDTGKLIVNEKEYIVNNVIKRDGKVYHEISNFDGGIKVNDKVKGVIDWDRRYLFMRYHTAAHVISSVIHKKTGAFITGNKITEEKTRIDFNLPNFDKEKLKEWEREANEFISKGHEVKTYILPREEAFKIPDLVKLKKLLPESIKNVRIVDIGDIDIQACGGTHVKNIKEIGGIEIFKTENKGKKNRRIYFRLK